MRKLGVWATAWCCATVSIVSAQTVSNQPSTAPAGNGNSVIIRWPDLKPEGKPGAPEKFTARFAPESLIGFLRANTERLPLPMRPPSEQEATVTALEKIDMGELLDVVKEDLARVLADRLNLEQGSILQAVPPERQLRISLDEIKNEPYVGPQYQVTGLLVQNVTEDEYVTIALYLMERARQLMQTGDPVYDRTHPDHLRAVAEKAVAQIKAQHEKDLLTEKEKQDARKRIGEMLGGYNASTGKFDHDPQWVKESRRFSYVVNAKTGQFIDRLRPVVERINREIELTGFPGPTPLDKPGIHFDPSLGDVEVVLPKQMVKDFLAETDALEQRMAEKLMISIEAVRLTDRDIVDGAVAARMNAVLHGVHNVDRGYSDRGILRRYGINALTAIANQQLQINQLNSVATGAWPSATPLVGLEPVPLPPLEYTRNYTAVGTNFSVGSDPIFFDGREQTFGFTYVDPNGVKHVIGVDIVDSLRKYWNRIERNLIVHKIKKDPTVPPTKFTVPVGPSANTFDGLAALISQEDQNLIVATGTGAISQISAKAGTWLVIQDFQITPVPGSSTSLSEDEIDHLRHQTMLTMLLRDPSTSLEDKCALLESGTMDNLKNLLGQQFARRINQRIINSPHSRTYGAAFDSRFTEVLESAVVKKKEENSVIALTFYSSQGNIIQSPGATQLGSANDLTALTTELRPNTVTPISSFVLKTLENTESTSPLLGINKGESSDESKTMAHLLVRTRFPTAERERHDLEEGRQLGYFKLPLERDPLSSTSLPFLSSSEHPLERLASFRVGAMFDSLQAGKIRRMLSPFQPNVLNGTISEGTWRTAMTRLLLNLKMIGDSPTSDVTLAPRYRERFILEVRSLLEYDPDFFDQQNIALVNMDQWNDADRIVLALNNSPSRFALDRLVKMIDELGGLLITDEYVNEYLARASYRFMKGHRLEPLSEEDLRNIRRDVANHFLRQAQAYGDAFLEATSMIFGLGSYRATNEADLNKAPLDCLKNLVVFDRSAWAGTHSPEAQAAHEQFIALKNGGVKGELFEKSLLVVQDMDSDYRQFVVRGDDIIP